MVAKQSKVAKAVCCTMCAYITEILWEVDVVVSAISPVYGEVLVAVMSNTIRMNKLYRLTDRSISIMISIIIHWNVLIEGKRGIQKHSYMF